MADVMADFHFMYPHWLWLLLLIPLLWGRLLSRRQNEGRWSDIVDDKLAPFVLTGRSKNNHFQLLAVISLLVVLAVTAMAGPSWEKREVPAFRKQEAVVVGLDLSASMYARDMTPNRLDAARFKLLDLLKTRRDGQTGLVVFAGDAFTVSPLTDDTETIGAQVKSLSPEIMPAQGSSVERAIQRALEVLDQAAFGEGNILLITDGAANTSRAKLAAEQAVAKGYTVSVLGVGTEQGAPIPMNQGGFLADSTGKTVVPKLDPSQMQAIARAGNGVFVRASLSDADINQLAKHWVKQASDNKLIDGQERQLDAWFNQGIWLVILLIPVAMLFFRRGWLTVFLLAVLIQQPDTAQASTWDDLWLTPDQQGQRILQEGDAAVASELFNDPDWKAAAAYRAGDFAKAEEIYAAQVAQADTTAAAGDAAVERLYNHGNALAMLGKLEKAIAAYEAALAIDPQHEDARYNLDALKKQQEQENQQNQKQQNQQGQQGEPNQQNQNSQQQNGEGQSSEGENAESQSGQQGQDQEANPAEQTEQDQSSEQESKDEKPSKSEQEAEALDAQTREQKQATEQWLRRIPDDPAGLWRRKFHYQYRQRSGQQSGEAW